MSLGGGIKKGHAYEIWLWKTIFSVITDIGPFNYVIARILCSER